jgi:hypothetical protein
MRLVNDFYHLSSHRFLWSISAVSFFGSERRPDALTVPIFFHYEMGDSVSENAAPSLCMYSTISRNKTVRAVKRHLGKRESGGGH